MKERPVPFNGEMVRAILDGKKTQTRRTRGLNPVNENYRQYWSVVYSKKTGEFIFTCDSILESKRHRFRTFCPYGKRGDRLYVKETYGLDRDDSEPYYKASEKHLETFPKGFWRSSRFMPKESSRITLEITNIRVERIQDITEKDIESEGIDIFDYIPHPGELPPEIRSKPHGEVLELIARERFQKLWDSINKKRGFAYEWKANPLIWVIEFKRLVRELNDHSA